MMTKKNIAVLPGDGIGPEIINEAKKVLICLRERFGLDLEWTEAPFGGAGYDAAGDPLPSDTLALCQKSDAVLCGAVGGPQYDSLAREHRPERGLLRLRSQMDLFSNLRPAILFSQLSEASALKPGVVEGLDIMIVRELTGGIYFGQPRGIETLEDGERRGFNTLEYRESEIRRIAHSAFDTAGKRSRRLCSVDKANVLEVSELWRDIFEDVGKDYPQVKLSHMYVDNASMQLVRDPRQFDVIATTNMFGDILSDTAAMLTGSIGMLPSASMNAHGQGLYEPIHGSAPDIAGKGLANPLATILSISMMLRYSLKDAKTAAAVESAVQKTLDRGLRTADIAGTGQFVSTAEMGDAVVEELYSG